MKSVFTHYKEVMVITFYFNFSDTLSPLSKYCQSKMFYLPTKKWGLGGAAPFFSINCPCHYQGAVQFLFTWTTPVDLWGGLKQVAMRCPDRQLLFNFRCSSSYSAIMSLAGCNRTEFTCKDASCVPTLERCDGEANCKDASDEKDCK